MLLFVTLNFDHDSSTITRRVKGVRNQIINDFAQPLAIYAEGAVQRWRGAKFESGILTCRSWREKLEPLSKVACDVHALRRARASTEGPSAALVPSRKATPGTVLIREWRGVAHRVSVLDDGVLYRGERYRSLSQVARMITGSRWSGPAFFGLRSAHGLR